MNKELKEVARGDPLLFSPMIYYNFILFSFQVQTRYKCNTLLY